MLLAMVEKHVRFDSCIVARATFLATEDNYDVPVAFVASLTGLQE